MKAIVTGAAIVVVAALGLLFIVPGLVPSDAYKARIETQLSESLGRDVRIDGDVEISTFPLIRARTEAVTIANPPGFGRDALATLDGLDARIRLWPLLSRRVEISSFTLNSPDIALERLADGRANWELEADTAAEDTPDDAAPFRRDGRYASLNPSIGVMRIRDGRVIYTDAVADTSVTLENVDVAISLPSMADTLSIDGSLLANGEPLSVDMSLDSPRSFLDGAAADLSGTLSTTGVDLSLDGTVPPGGTLAFSGEVMASLTEPDRIAPYLTEPVPALSMLGESAVTGDLEYDGATGRVSLSNARMTAKGEAFDLAFDGAAGFDGAPQADGRYRLTVSDPSPIAAVLAPDVAGLERVGSIESAGQLILQGDDVSIADLTADVSGPGLYVTVSGDMSRRGGALGGQGRFTAVVGDAASMLRSVMADLPAEADILGRVSGDGAFALNGETVTLTGATVETQSDLARSRYAGDVTASEESVHIDGTFESELPSMAALNAATSTDIPYADAVGRVAVAGAARGSLDTLSLADLTVTLREGALNGSFSGQATVSEATSLDGTLELVGSSLRALASKAGTELPPSTDAGTIFEAFSLGGTVAGPVDALSLSGARIRVDALETTGSFGLDMRGETPRFTGRLDAGTLDMRPYMAAYSAQRPEGGIPPWSDAPIP
ncbi:MAG: AsmA family protein, partial [Litorimonas sp.]